MSDRNTASSRVIYGLHLGDFVHLNRPATATWNTETENRYMEQVRERAQQKAKEILSQALVEAEQIRARARAEGFKAGRAEADELARQAAHKSSAFLGSMQHALQAEKERIFQTHKQLLFEILRLAFEKTLGVALEAERHRVLTALFEEAVLQLQSHAPITVYVCPDDIDLARDIVAQAKEIQTDLPECVLRPSPELSAGGVRIECGDGLVDNSIASRFEQVKTILDGYTDNP